MKGPRRRTTERQARATPAGGSGERRLTYRHENFIHVHRGLGRRLHEQQAVVVCVGLCFLIRAGAREWVGGTCWQPAGAGAQDKKISPDDSASFTAETAQGFLGPQLSPRGSSETPAPRTLLPASGAAPLSSRTPIGRGSRQVPLCPLCLRGLPNHQAGTYC